MKNQLYMLAKIEGQGDSIPRWAILAASPDYERIAVQYKATEGERLLLDWNIMSGVRIVRANLGGCQMSDDFTNINVSVNDLAGNHRSGLYMPVFNTVIDFLNNQS